MIELPRALHRIPERESGIDAIGMVPWGTHFCAFYEKGEDIADILSSYLETGLKNNEFCMCITSEPLGAGELKAMMAAAMPDFGEYVKRGQIEIIPYDEWYFIDGVFDSKRALDGLLKKLQEAMSRGYSGLRLTGNTFWMEKDNWRDFQDYEQELSDTIGQYNMIAMCTYSLDKCRAADIMEVANCHQFVIGKLDGKWSVIESQERKNVRKALQESDIRFRSLIQNSSDMTRILDREGRIIFDSPASEKILGYPHGYMLGKSSFDFMHPDDREKARDNLREVFEGTKSGVPLELRMRKADGEYLDVESTCTNMIGVPGVDGFVINARPITERKRAEARLRMLSKAVEDSPATVVVTDVAGNIEYVNPKFTQLTGYTFDEAKGKNPRILKSGMTPREEHERLWAAILAGKEWHGEFLNKKKNGELYWESAIISPILDDKGNIAHFIAVKEDITERKRVEKDLRLAQFSINSSADEIMLIEPDGHIFSVNEAACKTLGYSRDELVTRYIWEIHPRRPRNDWAPHWQELKQHRAINFESIQRTKDGRVIPIEITANYLEFEGKEYNCAIIREITERKRMEEELKEAKERAELYLDLMSHDINNINQIAMGYLELANETLALDNEEKELVSRPLDALRNSSTLIENVRKLQKITEGGIKTDVVDLKGLLSQIAEDFSSINGREVSINLDARDRYKVRANGLIRDIFANLIGNAIKHSGNDKRIYINIIVSRLVEDGKDLCRVAIEDNGPGVPDALKDKLFNRFQRGETTASGKGLGLYLVRSLVDDFHGRVWVEDRIKGDHTRGARFVVVLPAAGK
jgi:PAS domain S-box/PAS domain S-box/PAS domain S-box